MLAVSPGVVVADYARFLEDVRNVVRHELQHAPTAAPAGAEPEQLLDVRQAAELLGVTVQTVHEWKRRGLLPFNKIGGRTLLKRSEVLAALKNPTAPTGGRATPRRGKGTAKVGKGAGK